MAVSLIKSAANTGPSFYLSSADINKFCAPMQEKINTECGKNSDSSRESAESANLDNNKIKQKNTSEIQAKLPDLETEVKKAYGYERKENVNSWIEDHCYGLWLKPMNSPDSVFSEFTDIIGGVKAALQTEIGTGKASSAQAAQMRELNRMLSDGKNKITRSTVLAEMMTAAANANPCIKARRCILLPYKETEGTSIPREQTEENKDDPKNISISSGKAQSESGKGCCPGQTGHHVLPGAMFKKVNGNNRCGEPYQHSQAPVICVEGTGNRVGSHGVAHTSLDKMIKSYQKKGKKNISYAQASKRGIQAVRRVNKDCSQKCLQAQLDAHYVEKLKCSDKQLEPHSGMGGTKSDNDTAPDMPAP